MMRVLSPAKINLHLRVGPRAPDGFHPLLSWMCTVALHDTIEMTATNEPGIRLTCDHPAVPTNETNLIIRAARALNPKLGADVTLKKQIPVGGGLGGGSSNAAFALLPPRPQQHLHQPRRNRHPNPPPRRQIRRPILPKTLNVHTRRISRIR
jgi:4-diphosphocytidyl-2-C-methyl-D-erythritol kinase